MKALQNIGLSLFIIGLVIFISLIFVGKYNLTNETFEQFVKDKGIKSELFINDMKTKVVDKEFSNPFSFSSEIISSLEAANETHKSNSEWGKVIWGKASSFTFEIAKSSGYGIVRDNKWLFWFLTFGLGILGSLLYIIPTVVTGGTAATKNNGVWLNPATNRGWIGWFAFAFLVGFYMLLYFNPDYIVNWVYIVDPISISLSGNAASQWVLYGLLYCTVMSVMAARMYIKYRHNKYQILRTTSVWFFQIVFAFLIPEILVRFEKPWYDFKNAFPLDYDFFFKCQTVKLEI